LPFANHLRDQIGEAIDILTTSPEDIDGYTRQLKAEGWSQDMVWSILTQASLNSNLVRVLKARAKKAAATKKLATEPRRLAA
jgi:hypothetical protein